MREEKRLQPLFLLLEFEIGRNMATSQTLAADNQDCCEDEGKRREGECYGG